MHTRRQTASWRTYAIRTPRTAVHSVSSSLDEVPGLGAGRGEPAAHVPSARPARRRWTRAPVSINWADAIPVPAPTSKDLDAVVIHAVDNEFPWVARTVAVVLNASPTERHSPPTVGVRRRLLHVSRVPVVVAMPPTTAIACAGPRSQEQFRPSQRLASSRFGYPAHAGSQPEHYHCSRVLPAGWRWRTRDGNGAVRR